MGRRNLPRIFTSFVRFVFSDVATLSIAYILQYLLPTSDLQITYIHTKLIQGQNIVGIWINLSEVHRIVFFLFPEDT